MSKLHKNREYYARTTWTVEKVQKEINEGLALLNSINNKIVTFFGSHRIPETNKYYQH